MRFLTGGLAWCLGVSVVWAGQPDAVAVVHSTLKSDSAKTVCLEMTLRNTTDEELLTAVWADLYDGQNRHVHRIRSARFRLPPAGRGTVELELPKLKPGRYSAHIVAHCLTGNPRSALNDRILFLGSIPAFQLPMVREVLSQVIKPKSESVGRKPAEPTSYGELAHRGGPATR